MRASGGLLLLATLTTLAGLATLAIGFCIGRGLGLGAKVAETVGKRAVGSECVSEREWLGSGVVDVEVSAVSGTGPVSESVVNESNGGDADSSMGEETDDVDGDDGTGDKGEDSAEDVRVPRASGGCGDTRGSSEVPEDDNPSDSVESTSGSIGSCIRRVSSCWRLRCGRGRSRPI